MALRKKTAAALTVLALLGGGFGASAQETVKIGMIGPLTGAAASWGAAAKVSGEILASDINAKGGLEINGKKHKVQIVAYDDQYKAAEAVAAYNRLVNQDDVKFIVMITSASTMAVKKNAEDDKTIILTSGIAPAIIDKDTKLIFRLNSVTSDFMPGYAKWVKENIKGDKIICLNPNDETGWSQAKATVDNFKANGLNVVANELYERTTKDFAPLLTKVLATSPDIIDLGVSSPASAAGILRQARDLGYKGSFITTGGAGWTGIIDAVGKQAAEGLVNLLYADPQNAGYKDLVEKYTKIVGQTPNDNIVSYYDSYNILLHAIQKAGTFTDTPKIAAAINQILPFKSLQGDDITAGHQQFMTYNYVGVLTDGLPAVKGKIK